MSNFTTENLIPYKGTIQPGQRLIKRKDGTFLPIGVAGASSAGRGVIPTDYIIYASLQSQSATADSGQEIYYTGNPSFVTENNIHCMYVDGSSFAAITNDMTINTTRSVSLWIKAASSSSVWGTFMNCGGSATYRGFSISKDNYDNIAFGGNAYDFQTSVSALVMHHVCVLFNGSGMAIYIDGVPYLQGMSSLNPDSPVNIYVGGEGGGEYNASGYISGLRIYNRLLTASEISALTAEFTPVN